MTTLATAWPSGPFRPATARPGGAVRAFHRLTTLVFSTLVAVVGLAGSPLAAASSYDQVFMRHEVQASTYELDVARLGLARSHRSEIRAYAETLINDHAHYNEALRDLARAKDVPLPPGMTRRDRQRLDRLASTPARRFDAAFLLEARRINGDGIRAFRAEASRTADPDVRAFVLRFLDVEKQHDNLARSLSDTIIASSPAALRPPRTGDPIVIAPPTDKTPMPIIRPPSDSPLVKPGRD